MPAECSSNGQLLHESIGAEDNRWREWTGDSIGNEHGSSSVEATHAEHKTNERDIKLSNAHNDISTRFSKYKFQQWKRVSMSRHVPNMAIIKFKIPDVKWRVVIKSCTTSCVAEVILTDWVLFERLGCDLFG